MKNGFTLVELLVCIAIVALLGVTIGINANKMTKDANIKQYQGKYTEIFEATRTYAGMKKSECTLSNGCTVTLGDLVNEGLIDEGIYKENDPLYNDKNFNSEMIITVSQNNGYRDFYVTCNLNTLSLSEIEDYDNWREC